MCVCARVLVCTCLLSLYTHGCTTQSAVCALYIESQAERVGIEATGPIERTKVTIMWRFPHVSVCTKIRVHDVDHKSRTTLFPFVLSYGFKAVQEEELCVWVPPILSAL